MRGFDASVLHGVVEMSVEDGGWDQVRVRRQCSVMLDVNFWYGERRKGDEDSVGYISGCTVQMQRCLTWI
jgi:hypothetical protein